MVTNIYVFYSFKHVLLDLHSLTCPLGFLHFYFILFYFLFIFFTFWLKKKHYYLSFSLVKIVISVLSLYIPFSVEICSEEARVIFSFSVPSPLFALRAPGKRCSSFLALGFLFVADIQLYGSFWWTFKGQDLCHTTSWYWWFPDDSEGKESACNARDLDLTPGLWRSPWEENGNPL